MRKENEYCVIGLGKFGKAIVTKLASLGKNVLAIDENKEVVDNFEVVHAETHKVDSTNAEALKALSIDSYENVIVAIGTDIESSLITCSILLDFEIKNIIAKAIDKRHSDILKKLGVKQIVRPEEQAGINTALKATFFKFAIDFSEISEQHSLFSIKVTNTKISNIDLIHLQLPKKFQCNIVFISRNKDEIIVPLSTTTINLNDVLYIAANNRNVPKIIDYFTNKSE